MIYETSDILFPGQPATIKDHNYACEFCTNSHNQHSKSTETHIFTIGVRLKIAMRHINDQKASIWPNLENHQMDQGKDDDDGNPLP